MRDGLIVVKGLVILVVAFIFEISGFFLYWTYPLVRIAAILGGIGLLLRGIIVSEGKRWRPVVLGFAMGCLVVLAAWLLESMPTTPRKVFYIRALRVREGMSLDEARLMMAEYPNYSVLPGHISFGFRSNLQTEDVLVVRYDTATMKVLEARLSLD